MRKKCIVNKCENYDDQGMFTGELCNSCRHFLVTGKIGPTTSFLADLTAKQTPDFSVAFQDVAEELANARRVLADTIAELGRVKMQRDALAKALRTITQLRGFEEDEPYAIAARATLADLEKEGSKP